MLAGDNLDRTDEVETCRRLWPNIEAALGWLRPMAAEIGTGSSNTDGGPFKASPIRVGKTAMTRFVHKDGSLASGPIALTEVQGYVFAAWRSAERIMRRLGQAGRAAAYGASGRRRCERASMRSSSTRSSASTSLRSTATKNLVVSARPTRGMRFSRALRCRNERMSSGECSHGQFEFLRLGHPHDRIG